MHRASRRERRDELTEVETELAATAQLARRRGAARLARYPRTARVVRLARAVLREQAEEQVGLAASGAAFWIIISAFPTAIAAVSVFGLVVNPRDVAGQLGSLARAGPSSLGSIATQQLQRVAAADHVGLSAGLVISVVLAVWSASGGIFNLERAIRTAYGLRPERYVDARGRALLGALGVVIALGALAFVSAGISGVVGHLPAVVSAGVGIPALMTFVTVTIAGLYRVSLPGRVGVRAVMPGSVASACGIALVVAGFSAYLRISTRYAAVYGALAGAVIVMIGTYLVVYVVLLGAVLNVQLASRSAP